LNGCVFARIVIINVVIAIFDSLRCKVQELRWFMIFFEIYP